MMADDPSDRQSAHHARHVRPYNPATVLRRERVVGQAADDGLGTAENRDALGLALVDAAPDQREYVWPPRCC